MKLSCPACGSLPSVDVLLATRNLAIYEEFIGGKRQKAIANDHDLSESRVKAIVAKIKKNIAKGDRNADQ